jgi:hypothetical protein
MMWWRSNVMVALGRCSRVPAMNETLMSELVSVTAAGSPPCAARSSANAPTVAPSRRRPFSCYPDPAPDAMM